MRAAALLICLAVPAAAQDTVTLPQGCDAYLTVQGASCRVEHHFTCNGDPTGQQRRISLDESGLTYAGVIDEEAQWISSFHPLTGHSEALESSPADPASLSELIETGVDSYDFVTLSDEVGSTRYVGRDTLTGRQITIDEVTLDETNFEITAYDQSGNVIWEAEGREFINRNWRMFLSGVDTVTIGSESFDSDDRPVEFIYPGEPGFLSAQPKHGCGIAISSAESFKESANDNL